MTHQDQSGEDIRSPRKGTTVQPQRSPSREGVTILAKVMMIVALSEAAVMLILNTWQWRSGWDLIADPIMLSVIATPFLYGVVVKPIADALRASRRERSSLREGERRLAAAQRVAKVGNWSWDLNADELYWSKENYGMFGISPETPLSYEAFEELIHPEDRELVNECVRATLEDGEPFAVAYRVCIPGGEERVIQSLGQVDRDQEGRPERFYGTVQDVTERTRADEALRASERKYRTYIDNAPHAVFVTNGARRYVDANKAASRLTGYSHEELLALSIPDLVSRKPVEGAPDFETLQETGEMSGEFTLIRKDGSEVHTSLHAVRLSEDRFMAFCSDITERRRITEVLQEREERLAEAQRIAHLGSWAWNAVTDEGEWSDECYRIFGYSPGEITAPSFEFVLDAIHPDDREAVRDAIREAVATATPYEQTYRIFRPDGEEVTLHSRGSPRTDDDGKVIGMVGTLLDISERVRAEHMRIKLEESLRQTQKMEAIGTLAGGIAHDFNNILQIMLGYLDLARTDTPQDSPAARSLDEVLTAGKRATDLVSQILTFSRQSKQERRPLRIQSVLEEVMKLLRSSIPTTIEIRHSIDAGCGPVIADATEIHQVAMNLCTNAYHVMRESGGVLEVRLEEVIVDTEFASSVPGLDAGMTVRLSVRDTGSGMDAPTLGRIFDPYFTTKKVGEGTGFGLATVRAIAESGGGAVTVESEPGVGTLFEVYFPRASSTINGAGEIEVDEEALPVGIERLLMVDDEPMLLDQARQGLERLGYKVESRTSSLEALEMFRAAPDRFDVIITDQTMPHMTGMELAREMLRIRPGIPVILCTGFSEGVDEACAKAAGIRDYVMKPVLPRALAAAVRNIMDVH